MADIVLVALITGGCSVIGVIIEWDKSHLMNKRSFEKMDYLEKLFDKQTELLTELLEELSKFITKREFEEYNQQIDELVIEKNKYLYTY